jgi:hypothetical protein
MLSNLGVASAYVLFRVHLTVLRSIDLREAELRSVETDAVT